MPWSGTGTFTRLYSWVNDRIAGIPITASRMDNDTNDIVNSGLDNCLTRDGQGIATADLPMGTFKHTGVGAATARDQYAQVAQVQDSSYLYSVGGGTGNAITATYSPAITNLPDGLVLYVKTPGGNTTATPTFSPNGLTAHTITKRNGGALSAGEYLTGQILILCYVASGTHWEMINASAVSQISNNTLAGNISGAASLPYEITVTQALDIISSTVGKILRRGASVWDAVDQPTHYSQVFKSSGTFTIPATAISSTQFKFTVIGGGGGGGNASFAGSEIGGGSGGGSGGVISAAFSGFSPSATVNITIGSGGTTAGAGGNTTIVKGADTLVTANGGGGGFSVTTSAYVPGGAAGSGTAAIGGSGLTLVSSIGPGGSPGGVGLANAASTGQCAGNGGSCSPYGAGGAAPGNGNVTGASGAGSGGGGSGAHANGGGSASGGTGADGMVLVEWTL